MTYKNQFISHSGHKQPKSNLCFNIKQFIIMAIPGQHQFDINLGLLIGCISHGQGAIQTVSLTFGNPVKALD